MSCKHFVVLILVFLKVYFCLGRALLGKAYNLIVILDLLRMCFCYIQLVLSYNDLIEFTRFF
jgi:hypothetical protein